MQNREYDKEETSIIAQGRKIRFGARHVQIIFIFGCLTFSIAMRANFSIAIVAMTDNKTTENPAIPTYPWNNTSVMLSSFFWSYIALQILAGYISKKYGVKYLLLSTSFINALSFSLIPVSAKLAGSNGVIAMRVIQGLAQGCLFPCAHTVLGTWSPTEERSFMGIIVYSGISCGSILSFIVTGYVCSSWTGWPASFYIFAACGLVWCILYFQFGYNSPAVHPSIKEDERRYIETSLGQSESDDDLPIPWKSILTNKHFWSIVSANIGSAWGYTMMMTQISTYLGKVMKFDISSNGVVSAIPYMAGAVTGFIFAPLSDYLIRKRCLTTIQSRRTFQLIGSYGLVICLMFLAYISNTKTFAVTLLSLGNVAYSSTLVGYSVNHVDLSPRFAGVMQGISNAISQTIAMFSPLIVQFIVKNRSDASQWRAVFVIAAAFYFICSTTYVCFSSATRQKWDGSESLESSETQLRRFTISTLHSIPGYDIVHYAFRFLKAIEA